jgi:hypothetical protein
MPLGEMAYVMLDTLHLTPPPPVLLFQQKMQVLEPSKAAWAMGCVDGHVR